MKKRKRVLTDGTPCGHPDCLAYVTYPCEGCGRIAGKQIQGQMWEPSRRNETSKEAVVIPQAKPVQYYRPVETGSILETSLRYDEAVEFAQEHDIERHDGRQCCRAEQEGDPIPGDDPTFRVFCYRCPDDREPKQIAGCIFVQLAASYTRFAKPSEVTFFYVYQSTLTEWKDRMIKYALRKARNSMGDEPLRYVSSVTRESAQALVALDYEELLPVPLLEAL